MLSPQPRATRSSRKSEPRWVHIATVLRERILNEPNQDEGSLSDIALANEFKASTAVVRQAVARLVDEGLLTRQPGKGTFPRHGQQSQSLLKTNLGLENFGSWEVLGGGAITVELLSRRVIAANMTLAAGMGIKIGEHVTAIKRLRSTNGLPIAIDHRYMPVALVDGIEDAKFEKDAIWTVLSRDKGIEIGEATFTVRATGAAADIAEVLGVALNSPVLEYEVKVVDSRGRAVVIGSSFCHPDRFVSQTVVKGKPQVL